LEFELAFSSPASFDLDIKLTTDKFERCFVQDMVGKGMACLTSIKINTLFFI
jgi:hypothetical protein